MNTKLLGVPLPILGIACLLLTMVWIFVWPRDRATHSALLPYIILRWFHALTWLLLAVAAFVASYNILGGINLAKPIALLSLIVYLIFMVTFTTSKPSP
jgi:hypothetical protein